MGTDKNAVARVIANFGADLVLCDSNGNYFAGSALKKLGLAVCGDLVEYDLPTAIAPSTKSTPTPNQQGEMSAGVARVTNITARSSTLARTDRRKQPKAIAANVTQLVVVCAPKPPFDLMLLDRYAVAANQIGVDMVVVINKTDLLTDENRQIADSIEKIYQAIGYQVVRCTNTSEDGIANLKATLGDQVSILVGQSGVGKSSLLNQLIPEIQSKTGALSEMSGLGKHTTTVTTWYDLPNGGAIIDSAGVRQFALDHLSDIDIQSGFREISELAMLCKFNDCQHIHEPHCAVLDALEKKQMARCRYDHFQSMRQKDTD